MGSLVSRRGGGERGLLHSIEERRCLLELVSRAGEVPLDGFQAETQPAGDRARGLAAGDAEHDLLFDRRQLGNTHRSSFLGCRRQSQAALTRR